MKNTLHYVIFDGTSHYVGDLNDYVSDNDNVTIATYKNIDDANKLCDTLNRQINL